MTNIYRYSIIRYRPFAETGEFANIGVIATEIDRGETAYRLAPRRFGRVRHFFDDAAYAAYRRASGYLRRDLDRAVKELPLLQSDYDRSLFYEISKERESSVIFSEPRVMASEEGLDGTVTALYERFIGRNFETGENVENQLTKKIRTLLNNSGIRHLRTIRIDDEVVPIIFPLGYRADDIYAIKPLAFSQKTPLGVFDHGASWKNRLEYLIDRKKLKPRNVLLAVEAPRTHDDALQEAFRLAENELRDLPFDIVHADDAQIVKERVVDFAAHLPVDRNFLRIH